MTQVAETLPAQPLPKIFDRPLVTLDAETHDHGKPEDIYICELGIRVDYPDGRDTKRWGALIKPPYAITEEAIGTHGITNEMVANAHPFSYYGPALLRVLHDCDYCGYNVHFDLRCLHAEFKRMMTQWSYDDARIFDPFALWRAMERRSLSDAVRRWLNREATNAHRALEDAEDARDVLFAQLADETWQPALPTDAQALHDLCFPEKPVEQTRCFIWRDNEVTFNFGKHRGKTLKKIIATDRQYISKYMLVKAKDFTDEVKSIVRDALVGKYPQPPATKTTEETNREGHSN